MSDLVTLAEVKAYLQLTHDHDDAFLSPVLAAVSAAVISYCGLDFTQSERTEYADGGQDVLILSRVPVTAIGGIYDAFNSDAEVDSDEYSFDPNAGLIYGASGSGLVWTAGRRRWKVVYTGDHNGAPNDVKFACFILIADALASRGEAGSESLGAYNFSRPLDWSPRIKRLLRHYRMDSLV